MRATAVMEVVPEGGTLPVELIEAAYRASTRVHVVLIMPAAERSRVDRLLDPVVTSIGLTACGVRYLTPADDRAIRTAVAEASWVHASSEPLRTLCQGLGARLVDRQAAVERLNSSEALAVSMPSGGGLFGQVREVAIQ